VPAPSSTTGSGSTARPGGKTGTTPAAPSPESSLASRCSDSAAASKTGAAASPPVITPGGTELAITARPRPVDRASSASWVTAASPAHASRGLGEPVQEPGALAVAHQPPRPIDGDQPPTAVRRDGDLPPARAAVDIQPSRFAAIHPAPALGLPQAPPIPAGPVPAAMGIAVAGLFVLDHIFEGLSRRRPSRDLGTPRRAKASAHASPATDPAPGRAQQATSPRPLSGHRASWAARQRRLGPTCICRSIVLLRTTWRRRSSAMVRAAIPEPPSSGWPAPRDRAGGHRRPVLCPAHGAWPGLGLRAWCCH
jgi:hypothetical protein